MVARPARERALRDQPADLNSVKDAKGADCTKKMKPRFRDRDLGFANWWTVGCCVTGPYPAQFGRDGFEVTKEAACAAVGASGEIEFGARRAGGIVTAGRGAIAGAESPEAANGERLSGCILDKTEELTGGVIVDVDRAFVEVSGVEVALTVDSGAGEAGVAGSVSGLFHHNGVCGWRRSAAGYSDGRFPSGDGGVNGGEKKIRGTPAARRTSVELPLAIVPVGVLVGKVLLVGSALGMSRQVD